MRPMSMPALAIFLTMVLLTFVRCDKQPIVETRSANAAANTATVMPVAVALPNFTALVKKEGPAVINISTTQKTRLRRGPFHDFPELSPDDPFYEFFRRFAPRDQFPREFRSQSLGSGFIVSRDGYILTNAHLVENADEVIVRLTDKREFKAKVVGTDKRSDVAVLKISANDLPVVSIGDSSKLEVGGWVVAIGSPFGFTNSVSQGIVSAKGRSLPGENIVPFIQTDVPINPGNSGGPLFNMNGEVVGVNSQIYSRSGGYMGLSFAIPIDLAMKVKDELLKHGMVRRGRLGVSIQDVTQEQARSFDLAKAGGALVSSVEKEGPADRAGLEIGDIILTFDGKELASGDDLVRAVAEAAPGSSIKLQVWHHGAAKEVTVKLGEAEPERAAPREMQQDKTAVGANHIGLSLRELSRDERQELHTDGFLEVEAVEGVAAESGIRPGDIIIAVNSQRVSSIEQFRAARAKAGKHISLLVQREGGRIFIPLKSKGD
jgi:serine protease Do